MNLVAAMRGEYRRAETLLWSSVGVKVIIYLTTLATAIWSSSVAANVLLVLACVGQAALFLLRFFGQNLLEVAGRLRRLAMLQDGMGREVAPLEAAEIAEKVWRTREDVVPHPYYTSVLAKGPKRLVDITSECAFFSGSIARAAGRLFLALSVVASAVLVLSLVLIVVLGVAHSRLDVVAKIVLLGVTFWMTEDFVDMALRYRATAGGCDRVLQECRRLLDHGNPIAEDAYVLLHDYDTAVAGAPPLPARIYKRRGDRLAKIWEQTHSESSEASMSPEPTR